MSLVLTRPFLKLPTWVWLLVPLVLSTVVLSMGPPEKLPEPAVGAAAFEIPVLVTKAGKSFRFVPEGREAGIRPLWVVMVTVDEEASVRWQFGWVDHQLILGLYKLESRWRYHLGVIPYENSFKDGRVTVPPLTESEMGTIRDLLAEELNQRYPEKQLGSELKMALAGGIEQVSYSCPQNALIMLLWISLVAAFIAVWMSAFKNAAATTSP